MEQLPEKIEDMQWVKMQDDPKGSWARYETKVRRFFAGKGWLNGRVTRVYPFGIYYRVTFNETTGEKRREVLTRSEVQQGALFAQIRIGTRLLLEKGFIVREPDETVTTPSPSKELESKYVRRKKRKKKRPKASRPPSPDKLPFSMVVTHVRDDRRKAFYMQLEQRYDVGDWYDLVNAQFKILEGGADGSVTSFNNWDDLPEMPMPPKKRKALPEPGTAMFRGDHWRKVTVGTRISLWWKEDDEFYPGTIVAKRDNRSKSNHLFEYEDGDREWINLKNAQFLVMEDDEGSKRRKKQKQSKPVYKCLQEVLVGSEIEVWWPEIPRMYRAIVTQKQPKLPRVYFIEYEDGDKQWVDIKDLIIRVVSQPVPRAENERTATAKTGPKAAPSAVAAGTTTVSDPVKGTTSVMAAIEAESLATENEEFVKTPLEPVEPEGKSLSKNQKDRDDAKHSDTNTSQTSSDENGHTDEKAAPTTTKKTEPSESSTEIKEAIAMMVPEAKSNGANAVDNMAIEEDKVISDAQIKSQEPEGPVVAPMLGSTEQTNTGDINPGLTSDKQLAVNGIPAPTTTPVTAPVPETNDEQLLDTAVSVKIASQGGSGSALDSRKVEDPNKKSGSEKEIQPSMDEDPAPSASVGHEDADMVDTGDAKKMTESEPLAELTSVSASAIDIDTQASTKKVEIAFQASGNEGTASTTHHHKATTGKSNNDQPGNDIEELSLRENVADTTRAEAGTADSVFEKGQTLATVVITKPKLNAAASAKETELTVKSKEHSGDTTVASNSKSQSADVASKVLEESTFVDDDAGEKNAALGAMVKSQQEKVVTSTAGTNSDRVEQDAADKSSSANGATTHSQQERALKEMSTVEASAKVDSALPSKERNAALVVNMGAVAVEPSSVTDANPQTAGVKPLRYNTELMRHIRAGTRIEVWWDGDKRYYAGTVLKVDMRRRNPVQIKYDDEQEEWLDINKEYLRIEPSIKK